ncbi:MAG: hypothetical protein EOL92_00425 [Bacteroidia bacterium]|nr:hypothetical protein [Bacteroidia bacterium]
MDPQEITKIVKAGLILTGLSGAQVSPEHQQAIIEGAMAGYALLALVESWCKRRVRKRPAKVGKDGQ